MNPVLYYTPASPPCRTILLLGKMLDIQFELKAVNVLENEHMKPDFVQINPQHCIPTIDDNGLILWESRAILAYFSGAYGKDDSLYPKDIRTRAMVDQRLQFDLGTLYARYANYYAPTIFMGAPFDETKKAKLSEALGWFDTMLKGRTWAAADHFTIADLSLCVTVSQIEAFEFELRPFSRVRAWLQRCKDELQPFGYEEINQTGADALFGLLKSRMHG
ncbi:unnamed protein product [Hermetia illucens]|uniref:Uncharacterized protein n=2 Tax=Hermetia illucens TaxID=343691 RepID=A0A7R8YWZ6_HERIL|nr:glutathione S-transferase D7 isoform X2 [Hermetia illucens]CAD7085290.1 unnamed protein product [Hermetia illucens]